jgi:signal peptidase I
MEEIEGQEIEQNSEPGAALLPQEEAGPGLGVRTGRFLFQMLKEVLSTILPAIFIALFINVFVAQAMVVHGPSMEPTLYYDERVVVEKLSYRLHSPQRGDVVVVDVPGQDEPLIKRVMALPGETVEVRAGQVFIDGEPVEEPWIAEFGGPDYPPTVVPPEHVFILGDNRAHSNDSRAFGAVHMDRILGRAWIIYWPLEALGTIR